MIKNFIVYPQRSYLKPHKHEMMFSCSVRNCRSHTGQQTCCSLSAAIIHSIALSNSSFCHCSHFSMISLTIMSWSSISSSISCWSSSRTIVLMRRYGDNFGGKIKFDEIVVDFWWSASAYFSFHRNIPSWWEGVGSWLFHSCMTSLSIQSRVVMNNKWIAKTEITSRSRSRSFGLPFLRISAQFFALSFCSIDVRVVGDWVSDMT